MSVYSNNQLKKNASNEAWTKLFGFIKPNTKILDIGCSSGKLGAALKKEKKVHIIGVDIDKDDVELAKKNLDDAFLGNIETDDFSKYGTFDYVIMADVVEHLVDPVAALQKVRKLLNKNGKFVFSIPNMANVTTRLELLKGHFMYKDFGLLDRTHIHFYDQTEVGRVLNAGGFKVEDMDCTMREVPPKLLKKELAEVGIELNPKLQETLSRPDATIYQFIGVAAPGKSKYGIKSATTTPLDIISIEIDSMQKEHDKVLLAHQNRIQSLEKEIGRLDHELSGILNSRSWKAVVKAQSVKRKVLRKP